MGKATIKITDGKNGIKVDCIFDPPLEEGEEPTSAQRIAMEILSGFHPKDEN